MKLLRRSSISRIAAPQRLSTTLRLTKLGTRGSQICSISEFSVARHTFIFQKKSESNSTATQWRGNLSATEGRINGKFGFQIEGNTEKLSHQGMSYSMKKRTEN